MQSHKCPGCDQPFQENRLPLLLRCGHTLCAECVANKGAAPCGRTTRQRKSIQYQSRCCFVAELRALVMSSRPTLPWSSSSSLAWLARLLSQSRDRGSLWLGTCVVTAVAAVSVLTNKSTWRQKKLGVDSQSLSQNLTWTTLSISKCAVEGAGSRLTHRPWCPITI